jgi:hypothetical protein
MAAGAKLPGVCSQAREQGGSPGGPDRGAAQVLEAAGESTAAGAAAPGSQQALLSAVHVCDAQSYVDAGA